MRWLRTLLMLSAVCSMWATAAFAECVRFGPWGMKDKGLNFVFDGTVLELKDGSPRPVAAMQVHRVFKGQLPARIEVHHWAGMEHPDLDMGKRYVLGITRTNLSGPMAIPHRPFVEPKGRSHARVRDDRMRGGAA